MPVGFQSVKMVLAFLYKTFNLFARFVPNSNYKIMFFQNFKPPLFHQKAKPHRFYQLRCPLTHHRTRKQRGKKIYRISHVQMANHRLVEADTLFTIVERFSQHDSTSLELQLKLLTMNQESSF